MVLMRRKDKRRGNEEEEIVVASDSSIIANKGVRSLQSARTGRFAADMRVQIGGYGRADKTWGVDHPWHKTREDVIDDITSRDHLEDGIRLKEEEKKKGQGLSRAALKKKKAKMKKGGLSGSAAGSEIGSEAISTLERNQSTEVVVEANSTEKETKTTKAAVDKKTLREQPATENKEQANDSADTIENKNKKRKRVNRNKKKKDLKVQGAADSDDDSELDQSVVVVAKAKKQKSTAAAVQPTQIISNEDDKKITQADVATREVIATQYETAFGQEFTTASGLSIRDIRLGKGRVPAVGEMITVRYRGRIDDKNGIVFGKGMLPTSFGTGSVIAGWEECMGTMRAGGIRHLTVPPELGYGSVAKGAKIPANSTLFFEVELIRMGKRKRDAVARDEVPLPSSFQRKKTPSATSTAHAAAKKAKGKARRRKHSI